MALPNASIISNNFLSSKRMHALFASRHCSTLKLRFTSLHRRLSCHAAINMGAMEDSPQPGLEDGLIDFMFGKRKATDVAHL